MADENTAAAPGLTDEERSKELESRIKSFNDELLPLLGKYELGLGASAALTPQGTVAARPILFDARKAPGEEDNTTADSAADTAAPAAGGATAA